MVSRKSSTNIRGAEQTSPRDAILQAALRLLREHGASGLNLRTITSEAGCSTTGVYTWFGGKDGLVEAIYVDGFTRFGEALRQSTVTEPDPHHAPALAGLILQAKAYRGWALANPTHYQVMFGGLVPNFVPSPEATTISLETFIMLSDQVAASQAEGSLSPGDAAEIAKHLWASIHGYVSLEFVMSQVDSHELTALPSAPLDVQYERGLQRLIEGLQPAKK